MTTNAFVVNYYQFKNLQAMLNQKILKCDNFVGQFILGLENQIQDF